MWLASRWLLPEMIPRSFGICYSIRHLHILSTWPIFWSRNIQVLWPFRYVRIIQIAFCPFLFSKFNFHSNKTNMCVVSSVGSWDIRLWWLSCPKLVIYQIAWYLSAYSLGHLYFFISSFAMCIGAVFCLWLWNIMFPGYSFLLWPRFTWGHLNFALPNDL